MIRRKYIYYLLVVLMLTVSSCDLFMSQKKAPPRLSMFIGIDISGSFINSGYFDDSIDFLASYIYSHLNGLDGLEEPNVLFVGSIGGATADEPKTFFPKQTFENKSIEEITAKLHAIFPKTVINPYTDYNAFFQQVALTVKNKNLVLRPMSVIMLSDGLPDVKKAGETAYSNLDVKPLERLSRNVTIRLLYTDATTGQHWITKVRRKRVKMWTQDASVMVSWKDPAILLPEQPIEEQHRLFDWLKDNVDFGVRARRVGP